MSPLVCGSARAVIKYSALFRLQPQMLPLARRLHNAAEIADFVSKSSWSAKSLLPPAHGEAPHSQRSDAAQLRQLLRLSALPAPADAEEEARMLRELDAQIYFVDSVRRVDTAGVRPLKSLRDESAAGREENTLGLAAMDDALAAETTVGTHHIRIRLQKPATRERNGDEDWNVLGQAKQKVGSYFIVKSSKGES